MPAVAARQIQERRGISFGFRIILFHSVAASFLPPPHPLLTFFLQNWEEYFVEVAPWKEEGIEQALKAMLRAEQRSLTPSQFDQVVLAGNDLNHT